MVEEYRIEQMPELINKIKTAIDYAEGVPVTKTVTGNPIEITDGADAPLVKCVTQITGYQEGSGTPSPDNIRPIVAYTEGEIEVSDLDGNTTHHTTTFPYTIYRGSEDCVSGEVTSEMPIIDLGGLRWVRAATSISEKYRFYADLPTALQADTAHQTSVCETYGLVPEGSTYGASNGYTINSNSGLWVYDSEKDNITAEEFKASMSGVKLAYTLATPNTSSVTPTNLPIKTLSGYSHIESTTGEMEVEYFTSKLNPFIDLVNDIAADAGKVVYSTTERAIGTWTDGSILYEKTIVSEQALTDTWANYAATTGMDVIVSVEPRYTRDGEAVPGSFSGTEMASWIHREGYIKVCTPTDSADWKIESMTIRYTKSAS